MMMALQQKRKTHHQLEHIVAACEMWDDNPKIRLLN